MPLKFILNKVDHAAASKRNSAGLYTSFQRGNTSIKTDGKKEANINNYTVTTAPQSAVKPAIKL
jgi:hypothetical protein